MKSRCSLALSRALPVTLLGLFASAPTLASVSSPATVTASSTVSARFFEKSEAQITDDIAFAKGLAKEWGFVDLAGEVIKEIEKEGVSAATSERLGVVKCEIYAQGALAERDRARRNELFEQALLAYEDFLKENPNSPSAPEARSGYITMSTAFARSLEISMEEAIGEEAETLRARRMEVLLAANERTRSLIDELSGNDEETEVEKRERLNVMMMRAQINLEIGRSSDDGTFSFENARTILEDVTVVAGENTPQGLRAFDMIGQVEAAQQNWEEASMFFEAVIETALPSDQEAWDMRVRESELTQADKEQAWLFVELSTGGLVDALISGGDTPRATSYALHLYNTQRREGFSFSTSLGYPSLLAAARVLLDAGGVVGGKLNSGDAKWYETQEAAIEAGHKRSRDRISTTDLALRIAQQVVNENQGNVLRIKGQKLIADIIGRGGKVDPSVLYEAAEGKYFAKEYEDALMGFKQVLAALEGQDQATRIELGPKTFLRMGNAYNRLDRRFEAAMAFREGCTTWQGDPENDQFNANGYYSIMQDLSAAAPGDALLKQMYENAENLAAQFSERDADQILYDQGERLRKKKDYDGAIAKYKQVKQAALDYEKALVYIGVCNWRKNNKDEGYQQLVDYLETFINDPKNSVTGSKEVKRKDAMATAGFYRALHLYGKKDWNKLIETSAEFHEDNSDQTSMAPWVMLMVGEAYAKTGDFATAKQFLIDLMAAFPESTHVAGLSTKLYNVLAEKRDDDATDDAQKRELLTEMVWLLETSNKNSSKPSLKALRNESKHWIELENWEKAVTVLERIVAKYGQDTAQEAAMTTYILPDLADGLLHLQRVAEAHEILAGLMASLTGKPSKRTVLNYARSVTGWVTGDAAEIIEVPGAGQTEEAFREATDKINALANSVDEKWACEWYSLKFMQAYGYYKWATAEGGPKDSKKQETAKKQLDALIQPLGTNFKGKAGVDGIDKSCDNSELARTLGEDVLRRRMVWLWGKVK